MFTGHVKKKFRDETEPGRERRNGENHQRGDHDPRRFSSRARLVAARLAEEHDHHQSQHVERGQKGREKREPKDRRIFFVGEREDRVLAEEPAEWRKADQRERADHESEKRDSQPAGESAHLPDVLLVMEHHDDRTRAEEKQRFEEGVREQMEHRRLARRQTDSHDHVAELRQGRVGEDPLDVVLLRGDERGHHGGDGSDPRDDRERLGCGLDEKADAHQHVNARGHHGRGMDQRGDRRRPFHRVRQPDVQWELRRLPDRAAKDKQHRDREVSGITGDAARAAGPSPERQRFRSQSTPSGFRA